ncbi:trans-2,3-dihydro-3-hydroxyanthranilate isomerase [Psychromicrobium silvestre]|uniref:Trans-2,3-dihydro-3-hydroxyanthranilate isomerase n=1 Tax=Psychromicrobium silvestre TaxID=1645614 RepID=A0A7Y9S627_9MICC|nr:PhzF family phenazine biosynthesis protein [Psychromicrobium silvestre]NYE93892.1 trans-2,3-dihydro-3-hydroxyanthranilate isomerase [Psychromicrobium silvestre]
MEFDFVTVDVFTGSRFGGNPLAVFTDAQGMSDELMQSFAAEFNLSETAFVLPPEDPANTARLRIFGKKSEMPFAGHPSVGAAFVLATRGLDQDGAIRFELPAGLTTVTVQRDAAGTVLSAGVTAPQPLSLGAKLAAESIAACAGLSAEDVVLSAHSPVLASMGNAFILAQVTPEALARARPDLSAFQAAQAANPQPGGRFSLHLYAREGSLLRARMFAPLSGTPEDPATGSANTPLAGLLYSLSGGKESEFDVVQGLELGRPSQLRVTAWDSGQGIRAAVSGSCVRVLRGTASV